MLFVTARCHVEVQSWIKTHPMPDCSKGEKPKLGYVKLNGTMILNVPSCTPKTANTDKDRGTHIQLIDPFACTKTDNRHFDTYASAQEAEQLRDYLEQLADFSVIVGSMADEASHELPSAHNALLKVGVDLTDIKWKGSFAFVTQKSTNKTVLNKAVNAAVSRKSPAHVNAIITGM